jgi:hypothetical protein
VLDDRGFESWYRLGFFLLTTTPRQSLGPTQPSIQWILGTLSLGVKRPGREADHSTPSIVEVKNTWSYTSIPLVSLHGVVLSKKKKKSTETSLALPVLIRILPATFVAVKSFWTKI